MGCMELAGMNRLSPELTILRSRRSCGRCAVFRITQLHHAAWHTCVGHSAEEDSYFDISESFKYSRYRKFPQWEERKPAKRSWIAWLRKPPPTVLRPPSKGRDDRAGGFEQVIAIMYGSRHVNSNCLGSLPFLLHISYRCHLFLFLVIFTAPASVYRQ